jgi:zinc transporter ZupT
MPLIYSVLTFLSTLLGGLVALRYKKKIHLILGFTAGVLLSVVAFEIFPEIIHLVTTLSVDPIYPMIALIIGFMMFHILEKMLVMHYAEEEQYHEHKHPVVGIASGLAVAFHAFLDGVGIGLGFQISPTIGSFVALAVIAHDFSDGLNTVTIALLNKNTQNKAILLLLLVAVAPVLGIYSTQFFTLPPTVLLLYLGYFSGFLIYIGASDILPEAHSKHSSVPTILMTIVGIMLIFYVSRLAH